MPFVPTPEEEAFTAVADFYRLDKDLLQVDHKILQQFKNNLENSTCNASSLYEELFGTGFANIALSSFQTLILHTGVVTSVQ